MVTWLASPATVKVAVNVTAGFPLPDISVIIEVAGPDLINQNPTNFVARAPQTQKATALNTPVEFSTQLTDVGYYNVRASVTLSNELGQVPLTSAVVNFGIGQKPAGTVS